MENQYFLKDIYEELFKRIIGPIYIIILSLLSSLLILKYNKNIIQKYLKVLLFFIGFSIIIISELSYKFIFMSIFSEIFFIILPILLIILFYFFIFFKTNFKLSYL